MHKPWPTASDNGLLQRRTDVRYCKFSFILVHLGFFLSIWSKCMVQLTGHVNGLCCHAEVFIAFYQVLIKSSANMNTGYFKRIDTLILINASLPGIVLAKSYSIVQVCCPHG